MNREFAVTFTAGRLGHREDRTFVVVAENTYDALVLAKLQGAITYQSRWADFRLTGVIHRARKVMA